MFSSAKEDITTDASGDATVYLTHTNIRKPNGFIVRFKYEPGTIDSGATLVITGETSGAPIMTKTSAGSSDVFYYPRALSNEVADAAIGAQGSEHIPVKDERIKVVVSSGGATKTGSIEVLLMTNPPY